MPRFSRALLGGFVACSVYACSSGAPTEDLGEEQAALVVPTSATAYAFIASGTVTARDRTNVVGGAIGAGALTGDAVTVGFDDRFGIGQAIVGRRIVLRDRASAGDLFATTISAPFATYQSLSAFSNPPVPPLIAAFNPGSTALTVGTGQSVTRTAGNFGQVTVNGTLHLAGGLYQLQNLTLGPDAILIADTSSVVRVAGRVSGADRVRLWPAGTLPASSLRIVVAGANDTNGGLVVGNDARLNALVLSRARVSLGDRVIASGAIAASNITIGTNNEFTFSGGFDCNSDASCNDNNACTSEACIDGQCRFTNVAAGTACNDSNACTQLDTCQAGACVGQNPIVCVGTDQCRDGGTCDPATGTCSNPIKPNGTACEDGNACTSADTCIDGGCIAGPICSVGFICLGTPAGCVDVDECTTGTANCSADATCTNTGGSFTCACNPGFSGDGVTCTQDCTPTVVGFGVTRCITARPDGTVDLFLNPGDATPWKETYVQANEPQQNFCGPTAGKNVGLWYGSDPSYADLAFEMKTNTWDEDAIVSLCQSGCFPFDLPCLGLCLLNGEAIGDAFVEAGSLPGDMRAALDARMPPGYVRCAGDDSVTLAQLSWSLSKGDPVIYLESRGAENLHWAAVTGIFNSTTGPAIRIANAGDVTFADFQAIASITQVANFLIRDYLRVLLGVRPSIIRYAKASNVSAGNNCP
jgi:hypothetical protein